MQQLYKEGEGGGCKERARREGGHLSRGVRQRRSCVTTMEEVSGCMEIVETEGAPLEGVALRAVGQGAGPAGEGRYEDPYDGHAAANAEEGQRV